jgi:ADP-ribose pyrophosphatase YjhB (NUDIX family)
VDMDELLQVRVTGILMDQGNLLIVRQAVDSGRQWSLPGGRVRRGETLGQAMIREMEEETGLITRVRDLAYVCDVNESAPPTVWIAFSLERIGGELRMPSNEFDENPIHSVAFVPVAELCRYGFSERFAELASQGFPGMGSYKGPKSNVGLGRSGDTAG